MASESKPDLNFEVGYDLKTQKATFSIGVSNIFDRVGKHQFGITASRWWTKRKGKLDAKVGLPEPHATKSEGREEEIVHQREQRLTKVSGAVTKLSQDASDWITAHKPDELNEARLKADIDAVLASALANFRRRFQETREELGDSMVQYEDFRSENGLRRHAEVPLFFLKPFVILMSLLLFETLVNSAIFAGISPQGLIGGWITAVMISVINILMGLVFGILVIRYGMIWEDWRRYVLIGAGVMLVALAFFFNLYVAHFREVAEAAMIASEADGAALSRALAPQFADAWPHFLQNPFNLGSVLGVALWVIGMCIFGWATYEGYKGFTDPYPGFGKVGKRFFLNRIFRMSLEDQARATAYSVLDQIRSRIDASARIHSHFKNQVSLAVAFSERLSKSAANAEQRVNNHAWSLITAYRAANKRKRLALKRKAERKKSDGMLSAEAYATPAMFEEDLRKSDAWNTVVPDAKALHAKATAALKAIEMNIDVIERARKHVAELRTQLDGRLREALDEEDRTLNEQADRVIQSKSNTARLVPREVA